MPIDADRFRLTMARYASGVTVLVVRDAAGRCHGMTASAVSSLSLEPPMILACVDHQAAIHDLLVKAEVLGVHFLADDQQHVAERFADRARHAFEPDGALTPGGLPRIAGAIAHLDLRRGAVLPGGDHSIITGTVEWSELHGGRPLLYFHSRYASTDS